MKTILATLLTGMLTTATGVTLAADYAAGKETVQKVCKACHGEDGNQLLTPDTPRLAGQHFDYLLHSLEAYKKGTRTNPAMRPQVLQLSDKDLRDVAYYYSKQVGLQTKY